MRAVKMPLTAPSPKRAESRPMSPRPITCWMTLSPSARPPVTARWPSHHARQPEGSDGAGPAAIERRQLAQHAQVDRGDEQDVEGGGRSDGSQKRYPACVTGDDSRGILIEHSHDVALGQPDAIGR